MRFTRDDIIAHRFTSGRRKGYDTIEVDGYLERLAEYVGWMHAELARHQATERIALDVLQQAQRVAADTVAAAQDDAEKVRRKAASGMENARKDARAMLDAARSEADRTLLSARVQADAALERSRLQIADLEAAGMARSDEVNRLVEELRGSAVQSAAELRATGSRLVAMADHFEFEFAPRSEQIELRFDESVDLAEERVEVA
jgi:DivIVA domain-containing protein